MRTVPFTELLCNIVDNRGKTCPTSEAGIPLIATNCVKNGNLHPTNEKIRFVSNETYKNWFRGHPAPGDFIFVTKGSPGQICLAPKPVDFCIAQDMVAIRANEQKVYPSYLFAALRSPSVQNDIANMHVGTLIPHFKKGDFNKLYIPLPEREVQHLIGDIYMKLSEKIELNRQMNETLEAMARALFKSWFVDFDPVHAKAAGKQPAGLASEIADLFPSTFTDSPLGPIPAGWEVRTVGELFDVTMGQSPPGNTYNENGEGLPFFQGRTDFGFRYPTRRIYCSAPTRKAKANDTLVSVRAPVGDINMALEEYCIGRGLAAVRHPEALHSYTYYQMLELQEFFRQYEHTGTVFGAINKTQFEGLKVVYSCSELIQAFDTIAKALDIKIKANTEQIKSLTQVRDTLLPKLISGQLRVATNVISLAEEIKKRALQSCRNNGYVDIEQLCREEGIAIIKDTALEDAKAELRYENDQFSIHVANTKNAYNPAHELAHYAIPTHRQKIEEHGKAARQGEASLTPAEEKEAEDLAAEILMPEEFVRELFGDDNPDGSTIKKYAKQLRVSEPAMYRRLTNLGYNPPFKDFRNYQEGV